FDATGRVFGDAVDAARRCPVLAIFLGQMLRDRAEVDVGGPGVEEVDMPAVGESEQTIGADHRTGLSEQGEISRA
ncbi:hypothetical protein, partial [Pseudomonas sp. EL_65y_Pfl1_R83]|uniref:hypothetical protein n=1 Tax=Pseudomonas sp. EL_65y_Pfl1_R83 TaxID=3088697 RepID=UPI0030DC4B85